jgi:hypothetical protein
VKEVWTPARGKLHGAYVVLSASVPDPKRDERFLSGPLEQRLMHRVIDRRIDDAVRTFCAKVLGAGGRIVHGGHPKIVKPLWDHAKLWCCPEGHEPPILIYQSETFRNAKAPPGRDEMCKSGIAALRWTSADLETVKARWQIPPLDAELLKGQHPDPALRRPLLAMRLQMLLEACPVAAVCIGGMEGIEAEAHLYRLLVDAELIRGSRDIYVMGSTYGAAARLEGEGINIFDRQQLTKDQALIFTPTAENANNAIQESIIYDDTMAALVNMIEGFR